MAKQEFDLIKRYFQSQANSRPDVVLGSGDDCAIVDVPSNQQLAVSIDTLISGVHFPRFTSAEDIGYKALAVNLSDLAACGATPHWVTMALTLPQADEAWLHDFCQGFFQLAQRYNLALIGGDLTKGPLSITAEVHGLVPKHTFLTRSQAKPGDFIYVTGYLGHAGLGLASLKREVEITKGKQRPFIKALNRPSPRIAAGIALRDHASSAIDVSDGLLQDLGHILKSSQVGATLYTAQLPIDAMVDAGVSTEQAIAYALTAGDDYELCFTAPAEQQTHIEQIFEKLQLTVTVIGEVTQSPHCTVLDADHNAVDLSDFGYQHFT